MLVKKPMDSIDIDVTVVLAIVDMSIVAVGVGG